MEEDQIIGLWDVFKEYIADKNKDTAANHYVDFLLGQGVELSVLESIMSYDPNLDDAIQLVVDDQELEAEDEDDWDSYEEAEDD